MVPIKYFACKQCDKEFIFGDKPYCPKCNSFNIKPVDRQSIEIDNDLLPKIEKIPDVQTIKKSNKSTFKVEFNTGLIPRIFLIIYTITWYFGLKKLLPYFEQSIEQFDIALPILVVGLPLLIITFFVPIILYQSYIK